MIRTQVYITEQEKKALAQLSKQTGQSQSELIRQGIDLLCQSIKSKSNRAQLITSTSGAWKDNDFDFTTLRKESDRKFK